MDPFLNTNLISNREASKFSGYNSDYLARLCRSGKLIGKQIGRTWFIDRNSLEGFVQAQGDRNQVRARTLQQVREKEYRAVHSPIQKVARVLSAPLPKASRVFPTTWLAREGVAIATALFVVGGAGAFARAAVFTDFLENAGASVFDASVAFAGVASEKQDAVSDRLALINAEILETQARTKMRVEDMTNEMASPHLAYPDSTFFAMPIETPRLEVGGWRLRNSENQTRVVAIPTIGEVANIVSKISWEKSVASVASLPWNVYTSVGQAGYSLSHGAFEKYLSFVNTVGGKALSLGERTRDAIRAAPVAAVKFNLAVGNALIAASHGSIRAGTSLAYGTAEAAPESARVAFSLVTNVGEHLAVFADSAPHDVAGAYLGFTKALADGGPRIAEAVFNAEYTSALAFVGGLESLLGGYEQAITSSGALAYEAVHGVSELPKKIEIATLGALGKSAVALETLKSDLLKGNKGLTVAAVGIPEISVDLSAALGFAEAGERVALTTYETIRGWFSGVTNALAMLFAPPPTIVLPGVPSGSLAGGTGTTTRVTNISYPTYYSNPTYQTLVSGVSKDYLDKVINGVYDSLENNLSNYVQIDGTLDGGNVLNAGTVEADTGTFGTLSVSGSLSTTGANTAAFFVATDAAATSTFAGGLAIETSGLVYDFTTNNVGIGTTSPGSRLSVQGDALLSGNLSVAGITASATSTATYFAASTLGAAGAPAFTFSNDVDTGWWSPAANTLALSTAGAERLRVTYFRKTWHRHHHSRRFS